MGKGGAGAVGAAQQANSVSLSADGNTAIVGGSFDNGLVGAAWVFTRRGSVWTQLGNKLVGSGAVGQFIQQGASVALSADGNTAMVGGPTDNGSVGAAWVFGRPGITAVNPNAGTTAGGTGVTIVGSNFVNVTGVLFAGVPATNVIGVNANTIQAVTPPQAAGPVNVKVTTRTGASDAIVAYTYERRATQILLTSSLNPSNLGQRVTFRATVIRRRRRSRERQRHVQERRGDARRSRSAQRRGAVFNHGSCRGCARDQGHLLPQRKLLRLARRRAAKGPGLNTSLAHYPAKWNRLADKIMRQLKHLSMI